MKWYIEKVDESFINDDIDVIHIYVILLMVVLFDKYDFTKRKA